MKQLLLKVNLFVLIVGMLFMSAAQASVIQIYPTVYTLFGVFQYQITTNPIKPLVSITGNYSTIGACNTAASDFNNLLHAGSNTPSPTSPQNTSSVFDGICLGVLPPQIPMQDNILVPRWNILGYAQVQQAGQTSTPFEVNVGEFKDETTCKAAIATIKKLALSNTPGSLQNVFFSFTGGCYKLIE